MQTVNDALPLVAALSAIRSIGWFVLLSVPVLITGRLRGNLHNKF